MVYAYFLGGTEQWISAHTEAKALALGVRGARGTFGAKDGTPIFK